MIPLLCQLSYAAKVSSTVWESAPECQEVQPTHIRREFEQKLAKEAKKSILKGFGRFSLLLPIAGRYERHG